MMEELLSQEFYNDLSSIIEAAQKTAYQTVDWILIIRNWLIGKRIAEEELAGTHAERYGEGIVSELAKQLTEQYGKGFDRKSLYRYVQFYQSYPKIVDSLRPQSPAVFDNIRITGKLLSWTHYRTLLQVSDPDARAWYEREAYEQTWSVRTLQRNVSTQYYDRMLLSHNSKEVKSETVRLPFLVAEAMPTCFEAIHPAHLPYVHQDTAYQRLPGEIG